MCFSLLSVIILMILGFSRLPQLPEKGQNFVVYLLFIAAGSDLKFLENAKEKSRKNVFAHRTCVEYFKIVSYTIFKETLNKSRLKAVCTSCLHIFRQPDQKILVMRQHYCGLFVQPDEKSDGAICTNDLISVSLIQRNRCKC